jgi:hypothetical protein
VARLSPRRLSVTTIALLIAQSAGLFHLALVRHTRCLEHGELVDAAEHETVKVNDPSVSYVGAVLAGDAHGHDHCAVWLGQRHRLAPSCAQPSLARDDSAFTAAAPPTGISSFSVPPLIYAPKHSPPHAV